MKKKGKLALIIGILLILVLIILAFSYFIFLTNNKKQEIQINKTLIIQDKNLVLELNHISYVLNELGFYQLHNPPLSNNKPKINLKINDDWYNSYISSGKITTQKGKIENPDLIIYTSSQEILNSIISKNIKEYIKNSVSSGKTNLELKADYSTLFSKGYLSIYQDLTDKKLTASVIEIFNQH